MKRIYIESSVEKLNNLTLHILPSSKILNCEKVFRAGSITVFLGKNGKLYCNGIMTDRFYSPGEYPWTSSLMICLNKIGFLTDEEMAEHIKLCAKASEKNKNNNAKRTIRDLVKGHGKEKIEEMIREELNNE